MMRGFHRQIAALFLAIAMVPTASVAEDVTGQVTEEVTGQVIKVDAASGVTIALPDGVAVQAGDPVRILGDIPGVGPVAISTLWVVDSFDNGIALASPEGPPTGIPQPGYSARIATNVQMAPAGVMPSPEALSLYLAAQELVRDGETAQAADLYRQAADMGHPGAMTALGVMYSFGRGVTQDDLHALAWQERAARAGEVRAMVRLGLIHAVGMGTPTDFATAARWFTQAGDLGDPTAMLFMFLLYEDGKGVPKDFALSLDWLKRAADNGNVLAQYYLGEAYMDGEDGILPKDPSKGERYLLMAAKAGQSDAMDELSDYYEQRNPEQSRRWSEAAQQAGDTRDYLQDPRCLAPDECYRAQ
jgi:TPR repeat protein